MTKFEESIDKKRGMSREKFEKIRKRCYGEGKNLYNKTYTFGDVSSFLAWNKDKNGIIIELAKDKSQKKNNIYDGDIYNWNQKKLKIITTDIIFVGLNMSADGKPLSPDSPKDFWFQNARRHEAIVRTFAGTKAEGAYFTDIIKPDKRLPNQKGKSSDSSKVMKIIKHRPGMVKDHLDLFKDELKYIGANKPLLIVFGNAAEWILKQGFKKDKKGKSILDKSRFHEGTWVKIYHYAYYSRLKGRFKEYRERVRKKLKKYIKIPKKSSAIK
jgi:hypothetical protein